MPAKAVADFLVTATTVKLNSFVSGVVKASTAAAPPVVKAVAIASADAVFCELVAVIINFLPTSSSTFLMIPWSTNVVANASGTTACWSVMSSPKDGNFP